MSDNDQALAALGEATPVGGNDSPAEGVSAADSTVGAEGSVGTESPFFEYSFKDGEKRSFTKPGELADFLNDFDWRHHTYEQRRRELEEHKGTLTKREQEIESLHKELGEKESRINKINKFLEENPHVVQEITEKYRNGGNQNVSQVRALLQKELEPINQFKTEIERERARQQSERQRQQIVERLKGQYSDWDDESYNGELRRLQQLPEEALPEEMAKLVYFATRGKKSSAEMEQRDATRSQLARPGRTPSTTRVGSSGKDVTEMSRREQETLALAALEAAK